MTSWYVEKPSSTRTEAEEVLRISIELGVRGGRIINPRRSFMLNLPECDAALLLALLRRKRVTVPLWDDTYSAADVFVRTIDPEDARRDLEYLADWLMAYIGPEADPAYSSALLQYGWSARLPPLSEELASKIASIFNSNHRESAYIRQSEGHFRRVVDRVQGKLLLEVISGVASRNADGFLSQLDAELTDFIRNFSPDRYYWTRSELRLEIEMRQLTSRARASKVEMRSILTVDDGQLWRVMLNQSALSK
ncbi:hypothetical protein QT381_15440 [Galbitalea sp. SE-J8]|uniref:hypothetical protein n=1 Tax=Galbitalea sp. SE-J8 TaxID=3054952 RepID=UPI00259C828A|nr:hypothetical protein [Galbitalea sp. SE-J8]MDM4764393.1 hypothetical protein [Galbitalea sp. SE-J8]